MNNYYPPQIEGKLPAQYGTILRIPFEAGYAPSQTEQLKARIKQIVSNNIVGDILISTNNLQNETIALFTIPEALLEVGQHYKIQLSWDSNIYSTVGIFRYTAEPKVELEGLDSTQVIYHQNEYIATYSSSDPGERPYQYRFVLARGSEVLESSGLITCEQDSDSVISYRFKTKIIENELYAIQCIIYTTGGLEVRSPKYLMQKYNEYKPYVKAKITAVAHPENGSIAVSIEPPTSYSLHGKYRIFRTSELTNFNVWDELADIAINITALWEIFEDKTIQQGVQYKYAIQQYDDKTNVYTTKIETEPVACDFEDAFLFDGKRQLKIKYNPKISSFKNVNQEQKIDTIGSTYPFIFRNGYTNYKEFPISGLISLLMDDNGDFNNTIKNRDDEFSVLTDLTGINIANEREFKLDVLKWLTDGRPKLFRSPSEGNYIVRLMNTSLSPNDTLGRMLHTFSTTAYEIAPYTYNSLLEYGLIEKISNNLGVLNYRVYNLIDYRESTTLNFNYGRILTIHDATPGAAFTILTSTKEQIDIQIGITGYYQYIADGEIYMTGLIINPKYAGIVEIGQYGQVEYPILDNINGHQVKIHDYTFKEYFSQYYSQTNENTVLYNTAQTSSPLGNGHEKIQHIVKINLLHIENRTIIDSDSEPDSKSMNSLYIYRYGNNYYCKGQKESVTELDTLDTKLIITFKTKDDESQPVTEIIDFAPINKKGGTEEKSSWTQGRLIYTPDLTNVEKISMGNGLIAHMYYTEQMTEYESVTKHDI